MLEIPQLLRSESPAILWSGGKDSVLLLDLARKVRPDIAIIHFHDRLHSQVERVINKWKLEVLSWMPASRYLIPWNSDLALVSEYSFGDSRLPVIRDVVLSDGECAVEKLSEIRTGHFDYPWTDTFWGYRESDERHPVMGKAFPREFDLGPTRMIAPLYSWSDEDVLGAIEYRGIPYQPFSDEVTMCAKCFGELANWDGEASLKFFAERFGFRRAA